jgi:hypothetical protein
LYAPGSGSANSIVQQQHYATIHNLLNPTSANVIVIGNALNPIAAASGGHSPNSKFRGGFEAGRKAARAGYRSYVRYDQREKCAAPQLKAEVSTDGSNHD